MSRPVLGSTHPNWYRGLFPPGVKRPEHEADHSYSTEVKKAWGHTSCTELELRRIFCFPGLLHFPICVSIFIVFRLCYKYYARMEGYAYFSNLFVPLTLRLSYCIHKFVAKPTTLWMSYAMGSVIFLAFR
jgi:hypothetical protein